jgi:CO/xanthine dehydrogenase Mo-binding subunit
MSAQLHRREFLKGGASLVFALGAAGGITILPLRNAEAQSLAAASRAIGPTSLDTWLSIDTEGAVTAYFGKMDMGQGVDTAIAQVVAEELDVDVARVAVVMGDTHRTPNQGGASGSSGCRQGAVPLRNAAAEARRVLVARASERLGVPAERLTVSNGAISVAVDSIRNSAEAGSAITYADLIREGFATELDWNGQYGNGLLVTGTAEPKSHTTHKVVGTSVARKDIPGKILATTEFCHHVTLPGMLHGRCIRPPVANTVPVSVDASSIEDI